MDKTLHYLYDPLCGWCYGAMPAITELLGSTEVSVELLPTGLFSGPGARTMDDEFAEYAWSNDQRIERLTGQGFSGRYRHQVLADRQQLFDSGPATLALTAVSLTAPARELEVLKAIQHSRYIEGRDVTALSTLSGLLEALGLDEVAAMLTLPDKALFAANHSRIARAQELMQTFGARGVPTLIAEAGAKRWMMNSSDAYSNPQALLDQLQAASVTH